MASDLLTILLAIGAVAAFLFVRRADGSGLPRELRGARLVHAEETFASQVRRLVARLDRAYELDGELVLVELKTRRDAKVRMADVIELSVQRVVLQEQRRVRVSRTAWVVIQVSAGGKRTPHRVALLDEDEVEALRSRYVAVLAGYAQQLQAARFAGQCAQCGHRAVCEVRKGRDHRTVGG